MNSLWKRSPEPPSSLRPILLKSLGVAPHTPYATPGELADALQKFVKPLPARPTLAPPTPALPITTLPSPPEATRRAAPIPAPPVAAPVDTAQYQIKIYDEEENEDLPAVTLKENIITNSRSRGDTLFLPLLPPQRLYLVRRGDRLGDRYTVTDTGNGATGEHAFATLDETPLSPHYAAVFYENSVLRIGRYRIQLVSLLPRVASKSPQQASPLQVMLKEFSGQPGERISIPVRIQNQTREVDRLWLVLDGAPDEWQLKLPPARQLYENEDAEMPVAIRLPPLQRSSARVYTLTLRLISENLTAQIAATNLQIELLPAYDYLGGLTPETLRTSRDGVVFIENHGNLSRIFRLTWRDRAKELVFDPSETTLVVRPGEVGEVVFRPYVRQGRWFGREQTHPISILAVPQNGGIPQTYTGQVISRALIPLWAPPLVIFLVLGFLLFAAMWLKPDFVRTVIDPNGIAVAGVPFTLYWTPVNSCFYSIYEDGNVRQQFAWSLGRGRYLVSSAKADTVVEVRIRNCVFMAEKSWSVKVVAPTPMPLATPQLVSFTIKTSQTVTPPLHLLLGQVGDLCFQWEVGGQFTSLELDPPLDALKGNDAFSKPKAEACTPIAKAFDDEVTKGFKLLIKFGDEQQIESTPVQVVVNRAICYVNTQQAIGLYEGPERSFAVRGYLEKDTPVFPLAKPFAAFEQGGKDEWVQVTLHDDPRPGWVFLGYLYCPQDIHVLPVVGDVPPTPTPTPTETPTATPTPLPTATPVPPPTVSVAPEVINLGGCAKLKWEIQNVKEVYLNDEGVVGVAEREVCPTESGRFTYTWRIVQLDGSITKLERQLLVNPGSGPVGPLTPPVSQ